MKTYNKLVRDKIPEVIKKSGSNCDYIVADKEERLDLLMKKLDEEVLEFKEDKNLEELADIMEVLFGLANNLGFTEEDLLKKREEKKGERGGFNDGIVLQRVWSKGTTLGAKQKTFAWIYDEEKITIKRTVGNGLVLVNEFTDLEIDKIIEFIKVMGETSLANSVSKMKDGTEKDGLGKFIFEELKRDISSAQASSQLIAIFYDAGIIYTNEKVKGIKFWIKDEDWKEQLKILLNRKEN